jgi:hypothetical protein
MKNENYDFLLSLHGYVALAQNINFLYGNPAPPGYGTPDGGGFATQDEGRSRSSVVRRLRDYIWASLG